jgi:cell division protein FtsN
LKIDNHIAFLLYDHNCVIITDFGGFVSNYHSSFFNPAQNIFYPPSKKIAFNASLKNNDGLLANHISKNEKILYSEACKVIHEYVEECFNSMKQGKKISIDKIGVLFYDHENNIQFIPDVDQNFLKDSFGLSFVHATPVIETEKFSEVLVFNQKNKNKKSTSAWRLMELIPAAAIVVLLFTFPTLIKNINTDLTSLNPFSEKSKTEKILPYQKPSADDVLQHAHASSEKKIDSSQSIAATQIVEENPASKDTSINNNVAENNSVAALTTSKKETKLEDNTEPAISTELNYYIIAGCFRIEENAVNLQASLKLKGYDSKIIGKNNNGLTIVSVASFNQLSDAKNSLSEIKDNVIEGAWIMRRQ